MTITSCTLLSFLIELGVGVEYSKQFFDSVYN